MLESNKYNEIRVPVYIQKPHYITFLLHLTHTHFQSFATTRAPHPQKPTIKLEAYSEYESTHSMHPPNVLGLWSMCMTVAYALTIPQVQYVLFGSM